MVYVAEVYAPGIGRLRPDVYFAIHPRRKETIETFLGVADPGNRTRDIPLETASTWLCMSAREAQTALTTRPSHRFGVVFFQLFFCDLNQKSESQIEKLIWML